MAFATGKKGYLTAKLNPTDTSLILDRDIGVSAGRLKLKDPNNRDTTYVEWLSFASNTAVGDGTYTLGTLVRGLSQTADPATAGTGKTFGAGTEAVLVAMHDQLPDKSTSNTFQDITADDILAASLGFNSTTKAGLTVNNLTTVQRDALGTVANGMIIYNTTAGEFQIRQSGSWVTMSSGSTQPNASTTVAGKVEMATQSESDVGTSTGGTGAFLVASPDVFNNTVRQYVTYIAGEALSANDFVYEEKANTFLTAYSTTVPSANKNMGDIAANTRISMKFIGNGTSASTLRMGINKSGAPVDNVVVRIETDSAGVPSGTLVNANATATIAGASISTGSSEVTVNFAGSFTCTNNTPYHVVLQRSGAVDPANYYYTPIYNRQVRGFVTNAYNASWGSPVTTGTFGVIFAGMYTEVVVKTNATNASQSGYIGYSPSSATVGQSTSINVQGRLCNTFSGLAGNNTPYYLSNTPGAISTTPGTNVRLVGISLSTTTLDIIPQKDNLSLFENRFTTYTQIFSGTFLQWIAKYPTSIIVTVSGSTILLSNNTSKTSGVAFDVLPGDVITAYGSTGCTLQVLTKIQQTGFFLV